MKFLFFIVIQPIVTMRTPLNTFHVFFLRLTKVLWSRWHVNVGGFKKTQGSEQRVITHSPDPACLRTGTHTQVPMTI